MLVSSHLRSFPLIPTSLPPHSVFSHLSTGLSLMCVHPSHQRHGAGSLLMSWGIDQADSLGLESFVEATPMGKFLYEAHGYKSIKEVSVLRKEGASIEWKVLEEKLLPIGYTAMWRPVNGVWDDSEQDRTWRERMGVGES